MPSVVYFISGLGADKRVFTKLNIEHPHQKHIEWEIPFKNESIKNYSERLINQIDKTKEIILIGVSFGGIIAQEIASIIPIKKIIILSSVKSEHEFSWQLKFVSKTNLYRLFPASLLLFLNKLTANYYFGIKTKEESILLRKIINDTNPIFMIWAISRIMNWKHKTEENILHIHGIEDKIFPINTLKNYLPIKETGHFMVYDKASDVSKIINDHLNR